MLAAAGLEALVNNFLRLQEDHALAARLAEGLAAVPGVVVLPAGAQRTNMVYFSLTAAAAADSDSNKADGGAGGGGGADGSGGGGAAERLAARLAAEHGVLVGGGYGADGGTLRAVTHLNVGQRDVNRMIAGVRSILAE
jgi:threonine aldolase